jgi:hypothetical protein
MLSGLAAMVKTSILNGLTFDPFSFKQDGLASCGVPSPTMDRLAAENAGKRSPEGGIQRCPSGRLAKDNIKAAPCDSCL